MTRAALAPIALSAAVVALLALQVATSNRLAKLQDQVAKLEERPLPAGSTPGEAAVAAGGGSQEGPAGAATGAGSGSPVTGADFPAGSATGSAGSGTDSAAGLKSPRRAAGEAMSEQDVEALIEKKLAARDKKNPLASLMNWEDPMTVMERELKLSPIQKTRIAGHLKERDDATMDMWQSEEARKDWRATQEKSEDLRKKCDESVKRELDLAQQDKYEELKKSGKLVDFGGSGTSVVFREVGTDDEPEGTEPPDGK
ncbi:MAG: hypothetical protein AAB074_16255 [Planctomycetota bacterium]